jgi:tRNA A-37 threonylcarbamoyl transferase component Bud32
MATWQVDPLHPQLHSVFASLEQVFALEGERITRDSVSEVIRVELQGVRYYLKRYRKPGNLARRFLVKPWIKAEWQNLKRFRQWGIPTAPVVAWGLERRHGAFVRGAMVTRELPDTSDLASLLKQGDARLHDPQWIRQTGLQVARITRLLHDHHFVHNDLKWRNLLVDPDGGVFLIDCPGGAFWWGPMLRYRIVKDLACLDKLAKTCLSRSQRLRFYLQYRGRQKLNAADKKRIRQIAGFFEGRE